jgi:endoplasmic reticulum Man9GlcNAc2 1,2-alpha-mannosidase
MLTNYTEKIYENEWRTSVTGIRQRLLSISTPNQFLFVGERPGGIDGEFSTKMDHLVCFLPGTLALAATRGKLTTKESRPFMHPRDLQDLELAEVFRVDCRNWLILVTKCTDKLQQDFLQRLHFGTRIVMLAITVAEA